MHFFVDLLCVVKTKVACSLIVQRRSPCSASEILDILFCKQLVERMQEPSRQDSLQSEFLFRNFHFRLILAEQFIPFGTYRQNSM